VPVTPELLEWADLIFCMEQVHRTRLSKKFRGFLKSQKIVVLGIPDTYAFMDPDLIKMLNVRVPPYLPD
jgi:predicted protein tyrosine phosphatase